MRIKLWGIALIIFVVIFGGIGITMLTGDWTTTSDKIPAKFETGEYAGEYNPEDIRGSYTFDDVSQAFGIDTAVLFDAFGIPQDTNATVIKTKDIEASYGEAEIGNESVQVFVALYKGISIPLLDTYLPNRAVEILLETNATLTQEQKDYLAAHAIETVPVDTAVLAVTAETSESKEEEAGIKGGTTFQQALDMGITREQIVAVIGGEMPATNMAIRDYCSEKGLSFSEIKVKLNDLIEQETKRLTV